MTVEVFAPAKINLALHVTAQRADGYHLLDSLVVFADYGDWVRVRPAASLSLSVRGLFAGDLPAGSDNLVLRAAGLVGNGLGAAVDLEKNLPVASGIGGGSADAVAAVRALARLWGRDLPKPEKMLALGADLPICMYGRPARMAGIGDDLIPAQVPRLDIVLVNPGVGLATPKVFAGLEKRANPPMAKLPEKFPDRASFLQWLGDQRNDLEPSAVALAPGIANSLSALLAQKGCLLARMSGSGATCFGIFQSQAEARTAARSIANAHPEWWVQPAKTLN